MWLTHASCTSLRAHVLEATLCLLLDIEPVAKEQVWLATAKAQPSKYPSVCQPPQDLPISKYIHFYKAVSYLQTCQR